MIKDSLKNRVPNASIGDITEEQQRNMPLTAVVPGLEVDVEKLQQHMLEVVKKYPATQRCLDPINRPFYKYEGWSVTSFTGEVHNGWESQSGYATSGGAYDPARAARNGFMPRWFHTQKTPICTGYMEEIVDQVTDMGFYPVRVRVWNSIPGCRIGTHTDGPNNMYNVRLHIPIVTNPGCIHIWYTDPETRVHYPADGRAHMFRTNINHDTFNYGVTDRYHLIFEVWDTKGIVPGYKFDNIELVKAQAHRERNANR